MDIIKVDIYLKPTLFKALVLDKYLTLLGYEQNAKSKQFPPKPEHCPPWRVPFGNGYGDVHFSNLK
jgi:hypothetical protein